MEKQLKSFIGLFLVSQLLIWTANAELSVESGRKPPEEGLRCKISLPGEIKDSLVLKGDQDSAEIPLISNRKALSAVSVLREKEELCKKESDAKCFDDFFKERRNYSADLRLRIVRNIKNTVFPDSPDGVNRFMVSLETVIHGPGLPKTGRIVPHAKTEVFANLDPTFDLQPDHSKEDHLKYATSHYVSCEVVQPQPKEVLDEFLAPRPVKAVRRISRLGQSRTKVASALAHNRKKRVDSDTLLAIGDGVSSGTTSSAR